MNCLICFRSFMTCSCKPRLVLALLFLIGCTPTQVTTGPTTCCQELGMEVMETVIGVKSTAYYPDSSAMEGGFNDRKGRKLRTIQQFLDGQADYVSLAMDLHQYPYGQDVCFPELNAHYKKPILFRVVDTGGAFFGKGKMRVDVCVKDKAQSFEKQFNGNLTLTVCREMEI